MIWRLIFGKKHDTEDYTVQKSNQRSSRNSGLASELLEAPVDPGFRASRKVIEEAFGQVMVDVDAPDSAKHRLLPSFVEAHRSGDPRREAEAVSTAFEGVQWGEEYFGIWRDRFTKDGAFPYMWQNHADALCSDAPPQPATIDAALQYLLVRDMRDLLFKLDAMPKEGRPRKRQEFVELLCRTGAESEIVEAGMLGYRDKVKDYYARREKAKCELLAHTIGMRTYSLRDWYSAQRTSRLNENLNFSWRALKSDCPVENEYAAKFMANRPDGLPPFFPGDRTGILYDFD